MFWGSTYLGIRLAVEQVPPVLMAGVRFTISGSLMLAFCAATGRTVGVGWRRLGELALLGVIMLGLSNAVLAWSELHLPTGLAALLVSVVPIWFLLVERFLLPTGSRVPRPAIAGIALGAAGVFVLFWPKLQSAGTIGGMELAACAALLGSSLAWAFGSVLSRYWRIQVDPLVAAGWQMAAAGVVDTMLGLALGDHHRAAWNATGLAAIAYLVVFGSWVGYSAYVWLLHNVPIPTVATYAYVNPVVAVFLGWLFRGETLDRHILIGAAIIVPAVALVTRAEQPPDDGTPLAEAG